MLGFVDDDPIGRKMVSFALIQEGFLCDTATDGEQALMILKAKQYIAAAVERDPAFATKLLQLANNPFYNSTGKPITNVLQAITRIGQKRVGEFALTMSLFAEGSADSISAS